MEQARPVTHEPEKLGLLWAAEWEVQLRSESALEAAFARVLANPLGRAAYPKLVSGLFQALGFAPRLGPVAVRLLTRAFAELPDSALLPWLPGLLRALEPLKETTLPGLFREALRTLPRSLSEAETWEPPADVVEEAPAAAQPQVARSAEAQATFALLESQPAAIEAWAAALGVAVAWSAPDEPAHDAVAAGDLAVGALLASYPESAEAWAAVVD